MDAVDLLGAAFEGQLGGEHVEAVTLALREHLRTGDSLDALLGLDGDGGPWGSARHQFLAEGRERALVALQEVMAIRSPWLAARQIHTLLKRRAASIVPPATEAEELADEAVALGRLGALPSERTIARILTGD